MEYYVIEITKTEEGTATLVTPKPTLDEARMLFHQAMAAAYANPKVTFALCEIINSDGGIEIIERLPVLTDSE